MGKDIRMKQKPGKLYLIPTPIELNRLDTIPEETVKMLHSLDHFIVENARTARRFLSAIKHPQPIDNLWIEEMEQPTDTFDLLQPLKEGKDTGIMSEAGLPCIADPGNKFVAKAHELASQVVPLSGPSSIFMALMASGLEGQRFTFHGYLPAKKPDLLIKLREVEKMIDKEQATQIWIEAPYRNNQVMECVAEAIRSDRRFCIAAGIQSPSQFISTRTIKEWKNVGWPEIHKVPTVFLLK